MSTSSPETPSPSPDRTGLGWRHLLYPFIMLAVLLGLILGLGFWYMSTPQFAARMHQTVRATLERVTGGRVEMGAFHWSVRNLTVDVDNLTIHGKESSGDVPYFHVDHLALHARILSFFTPRLLLASLTAERPVLHLILYPDGTTNQPQPRSSGKQPLSQVLLDLAVDQTRVQHGMVLLNDRKIPWEIAAGPLQLTMDYQALAAVYAAQLDVRNISFRLQQASEAHSRMRAEFHLGRDQFRLDRFDLQTGSSHLALSGTMQNFSHPTWRVAAQGALDAREMGALIGQDSLRKGLIQLRMQAHGAPAETAEQNFQTTGHLDLYSGAWQSPWLRLQNVDLHTDFLVDDDQCSFSNVSSRLEDGGRIVGSLMLRHCMGPAKPVMLPSSTRTASSDRPSWLNRQRLSPRALLQRLHRGSAPVSKPQLHIYQPLQAELQAQVTDVTLPMVMAAVAPKQFWNIGFTTATSGHVIAHWTADGQGLDVHGDLTMHAPARTLGLVPVTGFAHADYLGDHEHLVIQQAEENTPATSVHASGTLTLLTNDPHTDLRLDTTGSNLGEFDRLLTVLDLRVTPSWEAHTLPLNLLGPASFHGNIHGSFFALEAVGHLNSGPFQMVVATSSPTAPHQEHRLSWDGFQADLSYTPSQLTVRNADLLRGHTILHTAFHLAPQRTAAGVYTYNRHTRMVATLQAGSASLADIASAMGGTGDISGQVTASAHIAGAAEDLEGSGHLTLHQAEIRGVRIPAASMQLLAHNHALQATDIRVTAAGGAATGNLLYNPQSGAIQGSLNGQGFSLHQLTWLHTAQLSPAGNLSFQTQAAGTLQSPHITATLQVPDLALNDQSFGVLHAEATLQDGLLVVTSRANLSGGQVEASGKIQLQGEEPLQAQLAFTHFNVGPLLRIFAPQAQAEASLDGSATLSGPWKQPAALTGEAHLQPFTATLDRRPVRSVGAVELSLREGRLQLASFHLQGQNVDFTANGTVDLLRQNRLRLSANGDIDAALISDFRPDVQSSGNVRFAVNARGTLDQPDLRGTAQVSHLSLHVMNITNGLTDMNGQMVFDQDRLVVQQLTGSSGGGQLTLSGFVGYRKGLFVDVTAVSKDVRVRYPKGISSSVDAKLRLLGNSSSLLLSGNAVLTRFGVGSSFDLTALANSGGSVAAPIDPSSPLNRIRLDVHLTSAPQLGFQNSFASLAGEVNLRVRGTLENPSVLGRIDISEGSASFAGTKYRLQQGDIVFNNPVTIEPQIDLEASARVQNYDIIITLHGPPSKLDISYRSEPPLTQSDVLALLALGRTNEQAAMYGEQQQANANPTTEALLGGALNAAVSNRVQKLFGVGSVRVDPNFVGTLGQSTARVTVEEQVGHNVTLTFATNINTTAQQLIQAQFDLTRSVSLIAVRDEADVFSMYLQIRGKHR